MTTRLISQLLYDLEFYAISAGSKEQTTLLDTIIDCIKTLQNERAELREWVESEVSHDTWVRIANKYGWE